MRGSSSHLGDVAQPDAGETPPSNRSPFGFTGKINKVVFDIIPHLTVEDRQAIQHEQHVALADGNGA